MRYHPGRGDAWECRCIRVEVLVLERPDFAHGAREAVAGMDQDFHRIEVKTAAARQSNVPLLCDE
jgi:hypothetical protein